MDEKIVEVELPDGRILKFPSSMDQELMRQHAVKAMSGGGEVQGGRNVRGFKGGLRPDKPGDKSNMLKGAAGAGMMALPEIIPMLAALFSKGGQALPKAAGNVEKVSREAFDALGHGNVQKMGGAQSIMGGDPVDKVRTMFGGLNGMKEGYQNFPRGAMTTDEILQMTKNLKETAKAGVEGVTRRVPK